MSDEADLADEGGILSADDAISIGIKIGEMADRVKAMHAVVPGTQASWAFQMDDVTYRVTVTVDHHSPLKKARAEQ